MKEIDARWLLDEILEKMDEDDVVIFRPEKDEERIDEKEQTQVH